MWPGMSWVHALDRSIAVQPGPLQTDTTPSHEAHSVLLFLRTNKKYITSAPLLTSVPSRKPEFRDDLFTIDTYESEISPGLAPEETVTLLPTPPGSFTASMQSSERALPQEKIQALFAFRVAVLIKADVGTERVCHFFFF